MNVPDQVIEANVRAALEEDIGAGDITAQLISADSEVVATVIVRESATISGIEWFNTVFQQIDNRVRVDWQVSDGDKVTADQALCQLQGPSRAILSGERSALNFLQTLSATATRTRAFADAVNGTGCKILDTRKTLPGLRLAQKYAVLCGGGYNHRIGLYDAILIKENHIIAAGSITAAIQQARGLHTSMMIEVEVETLSELKQAITAGAQRCLLDNMTLDTLREAVSLANGRIELEASGGINLNTVRHIAETGVDFISVGELTKHIQAVDLSMRFDT